MWTIQNRTKKSEEIQPKFLYNNLSRVKFWMSKFSAKRKRSQGQFSADNFTKNKLIMVNLEQN